MSSTSKLSKKQKKSLAFRQRKGKGKDEQLDVPITEDQDAAELELGDQLVATVEPPQKVNAVASEDRKRKRREGDVEASRIEPTKEPKRRKKDDDDGEIPEDSGKLVVSEAETKTPKKSRFILFVGTAHVFLICVSELIP